MSNVVNLHGRCGSCGKPGRLLTLAVGEVTARAVTCEACFDEAVDFMAGERKLFEALLALGVSRELANVMMIAKHNHERENRS